MPGWRALRGIVDAALVRRTTALRIGLSFVVPLSIAAALGQVTWGALATQGAFAAMYARDEPYRRRLRVMVAIGCALTLAVVLGTLAAASPWAIAIGAGAVAGVATLGCLAWNVGNPREFMIVLAFLAATALPGDASEIPKRAALVLAGAAIVTAIAMAGRLRRPRGPEERALTRAYLVLARLIDAVGRETVQTARHEALVALEQARNVLTAATGGRSDGDRLVELALAGEAIMDTVLGLVLRESDPLDPGWGAATRRIAASVADPQQGTGITLPDEVPALPHGPRFVAAMERAQAAADPALAMQLTLVPFGRRSSRRAVAVLRRALRPGSLVVPTAARVALATAIGTGLGMAIGVERGFWVGLTTVAVLQASNVTLTARRTLQRAVGTIVGVGLAAAVLSGHPGVLVIIVALAVCQTITQATVVASYGLATVFATPIALLIVDLGQPGEPAGALLGARVIDTLLGCAVGLLARRLFWPRTAATQLPAAQAAVIEAVQHVLHAALTRADTPSSSLVRRSRRALHTALLNLRATHTDAIGDLVWKSAAADARWTTTLAVQRLAYAAMAFPAPRDADPPDRELVAGLDSALEALAAIAIGHRTPALVPLPPLEGYPATRRALIELRDILRSRGTAPGKAPAPDH